MCRFLGFCWIRQVSTVWTNFKGAFLELWSDEELHKGQAYLRAMYPDTKGLEDAQAQYMQMLWQVTPPALERSRFQQIQVLLSRCKTVGGVLSG